MFEESYVRPVRHDNISADGTVVKTWGVASFTTRSTLSAVVVERSGCIIFEESVRTFSHARESFLVQVITYDAFWAAYTGTLAQFANRITRLTFVREIYRYILTFRACTCASCCQHIFVVNDCWCLSCWRIYCSDIFACLALLAGGTSTGGTVRMTDGAEMVVEDGRVLPVPDWTTGQTSEVEIIQNFTSGQIWASCAVT